jgi:hypothetical protein
MRTHDQHITTHIHTLTSITSFAHAPYWPYCSSYNFDFRVRVVETLDATCATNSVQSLQGIERGGRSLETPGTPADSSMSNHPKLPETATFSENTPEYHGCDYQ